MHASRLMQFSHTFLIKFLFLETTLAPQFLQYTASKFCVLTNFDLLILFLHGVERANIKKRNLRDENVANFSTG